MSVFWGLDNFKAPDSGVAVTIGTFDGVHLGHQALLEQLVSTGRQQNLPTVALTFDCHPLEILAPQKTPPLIQTTSDRIHRLADSGVQDVIALHFDEAMAHMEPRDFVQQVLLDRIHTKALVVGENFRFGRARSGTPALLKTLGEELGFSVAIVPPLVVDGRQISSTLVRLSVASGDVRQAARLLGATFRVKGVVVHGDGRGREIGYPTANIDVPTKYLKPGNGVYAVTGRFGDTAIRGAASIGTRPTVGGTTLTLEVYLIGFDGDLYGQEMEVLFLDKLRDEEKFESIEEMVTQIGKDVHAALQTSEPAAELAAR